MKLTLAIVGLGSNLGDREAYLKAAADRLRKLFPADFALSPVYETQALTEGQAPYLNQVAYFACRETPQDLLKILRGVELLVGRKAVEERWADREIDLDLLALGRMVYDEDGLRLPHPEMGNRPFVLKPLNDLLPEWRHPVGNWTAGERLATLEETGPGAVIRKIG